MQGAHIDQILNAFVSDESQDGFAAWLSADEIRRRRYSLAVRRYVSGAEDGSVELSLEDALAEVRVAMSAARNADEDFEGLLLTLESEQGSQAEG